MLLPEIIRDLRLTARGLKILPRTPSSFTPLLDGRSLTLGLNAQSNRSEISKFSRRDADAYPRYNQLLERVPDATLNLGNHRGNRLQGLEDYRAVMPQVGERARVLLDTGHLLSVGEDVLAFAEAFADRVGLVHLRDQRGEKPVPFGQGDLPCEPLLRLLGDAGYDGYLVVELEQVDWAAPQEALVASRECVEEVLNRL